MRKPLKIILTVLGVTIACLAIAPLFIDPNDFKPELSALVKEKTGRDLTIDGDLQLSVFPWLGVSTGKLALSNAPGFQDKAFATVEQAEASIKLLPLFTKQFEISQVVVKGLNLNLATNPEGLSNWSDLSPAESAPANNHVNQAGQSAATATLAAFAVGGISIENAHIDWDDQQAKQHYDISQISLKTGPVAFTKPIAVDLAFVAVNSHTQVTNTVQLNSDVMLNEHLDGFQFSKPNLQLKIAGENIPNKQLPIVIMASDIAVDLPQQTIKATGLQTTSSGMVLSSELVISNIKTKLKLDGPISIAAFNPSNTLKQLGVAMPAMQDGNAFTKLALTGQIQADADVTTLSNLDIQLDESKLTGSVGIKTAAQTAYSFNLAIDTINADRYLSAETGKATKSLASPAVALAAATAMVPLASLQKLNADGELAINTLKVNGLSLQGLRLNLNAKEGVVKTSQSAQQFYQGDYSSHIDVDANKKQPMVSVSEKINHVQLGPLLKDAQSDIHMTGILDASSELTAQGNKAGQLKSSLNGSLRFLLKDSVIQGFNLQKIIDEGKALVKGDKAPADSKSEQTLFSELSGTADIANGVIQTNDLLGAASKLQLSGKGSADLNTEKLDYKIKAKLPNEATPEVTINIAGSFKQPSYQIDVAKLLTDKNTVKVVDKLLEHNKDKIGKLLDKLDKKLGPGAGDLLKQIFK